LAISAAILGSFMSTKQNNEDQ
jgi:hypothetical protein